MVLFEHEAQSGANSVSSSSPDCPSLYQDPPSSASLIPLDGRAGTHQQPTCRASRLPPPKTSYL